MFSMDNISQKSERLVTASKLSLWTSSGWKGLTAEESAEKVPAESKVAKGIGWRDGAA